MAIVAANIKKAICTLFEVHDDEKHSQRVVTPIEFPGTSDRVVIRVRPQSNGAFLIDENGEAALYASMADGDIESEASKRWIESLHRAGQISFNEDEVLSLVCTDERLIAPSIFRIAEASQQLYAIATARVERQVSDFPDRLGQTISSICAQLNLKHESNAELPISGGLVADFVVQSSTPLIVIAATGTTRLLEAEVIHMQYQAQNKPGFVLAIVENQSVVGKKQFERANYYTGKTVTYDDSNLRGMITAQLR